MPRVGLQGLNCDQSQVAQGRDHLAHVLGSLVTKQEGLCGCLQSVLSSSLQKHEFSVDMTCEGCSNAVTRVLNKLGGVQFEIDLPNKKVCIDSEHSVDTLLETLKKTGKSASYLGEK
uniref:Copper transport protein ATOX1 n=1 Tax=Pelodiscus sinensis TaxID=13735 RepID=K7G7Y8_PELSI|nr:copper transport protein ATOX1 [Pelodiscus sinensis]XP_025034838.1 copper transport protein ATOX1 [Pelodiscus sinensis]|eukprot:XP_006138323.1 copper transport protein ATOX1 [Pelodiscus sinensis]